MSQSVSAPLFPRWLCSALRFVLDTLTHFIYTRYYLVCRGNEINSTHFFFFRSLLLAPRALSLAPAALRPRAAANKTEIYPRDSDGGGLKKESMFW